MKVSSAEVEAACAACDRRSLDALALACERMRPIIAGIAEGDRFTDALG